MPSNWRELPASTTVTFAPQGGYGSYQGQDVFTHGVQIGVDPNESHNLRTASSELVEHLRQNNPQMRQSRQFASFNFAGRNGLATILTNVSEVTNQQERIALYTTLLADGSLFYVAGVAPNDEFSGYQSVFNQVVRSIQLTDGYRNSRY